MFEKKLSKGSRKEELFEGILELIEKKFGTNTAKEGAHLFFAPDGCTDEDIDKAHQEYIRDGGDPDIPFIVIHFVPAKKSPPQEAKDSNEGNIERDRGTPKNPNQIAEQRLDKPSFADCLD